MTANILTQEELKDNFYYDPETGVFHQLKSRRGCPAGVAGSDDAAGYLAIAFNCKRYRLHRLAFLYMTGSFPEFVDHINHNRKDNRWENLRAASRQENQRNMSKYSTNTSGTTGVYWHKYAKKWLAIIMINQKNKHLGLFANKTDAIIARKMSEYELGFHQNHGV